MAARKSKSPTPLNFDHLASAKAHLADTISTLDSIVATSGSVSDSSVFSLSETAQTLKKVAEDLLRHCDKFRIYRKVANKVFEAACAKEKALGKPAKVPNLET